LSGVKQTRLLTIFLVLLLVVAFTYLLGDYARQHKRQAGYNLQINAAVNALAQIPAPETDLESRLSDLTASSSQALASISDNSLNSTSIIDTLMKQAESYNLSVTPLTTDSWIEKKVNNSMYKVLPIKMQLNGNLEGMLDFIKTLDNTRKYPYLMISAIDIIHDPEEITSETNTNATVTAEITFNIIIRYNPQESK
jgi:cell division protein FtsB